MASEFAPLGLYSTLHPSVTRNGFASHMLNCYVGRGVIEARAGIAELWQRTSPNNGDIFWGAGFGRYNGTAEYFALIQKNGDSLATGFSISSSGSLLKTDTTVPWQRTASNWFFKQNGEYIYGANESDGLWRKKIGDTSESAWRQVQLFVVNSTETNSSAELERPAPDYVQTVSFNTGSWTGTSSVVSTVPFGSESTSVTDGVITSANAGNTGSPRYFESWIVFEFTTAVDWSTTRYFNFPIWVDCAFDDARKNEEPFIDIDRAFTVVISEDATAPSSSVSDFTDAKWKNTRCYPRPLEESPVVPGVFIKVGLAVDMDHAQFGGGTNNINAVKKIAIRIPLRSGNDYNVNVGIPWVGGTMMSKAAYWHYMDGNEARTIDPISFYGAQTFKDLEYAIVSYNTGSGAESTAEYETVSGTSVLGLGKYPQSLPLGAGVRISHDAAAVGYDRVRIYRRRHSSSRQWRLIYQSGSSASGSYVDFRVDAVGDLLDWDYDLGAVSPVTYAEDHDFGVVASLLAISAIESWRGHMVLGVGTEVYLSFQGQPHRYVAPLRLTAPGAFITDDPTIGRTLYMSYTLGDKVLALHAPDELYGIGSEGVYAMVGDDALTASPFRKLPGAFGSLGARASCSFESGVLVAALSGLYFYQIARLGAAVEETRTSSAEMTKDVRDTYQYLLAKGAANDVVVQVLEDEIYIIRGRYFMKRNREMSWEFGAWDATALASGGTTPATTYGTITALPALPARKTAVTRGASKNSYTGFDFALPTPSGSPGVGMVTGFFDTALGSVAFSRTGVMFQLNRSVAGAAYVTDAGYAIPWVYSFVERAALDAQMASVSSLLVETADTASTSGVVRLIMEEYDGVSGSRVYATDRASNATKYRVLETNSNGGFGHTLTLVSQSAAHKVIRTDIDFSYVGKRRGN